MHLFLWLHDVDAYHREIVDRGAVVTQAPIDRPYGVRELVLRDPNGIELVVGQDVA